MKRFVLMMQFLTRLPIPIMVPATQEDFEKGVVYFPVAGILIGLMLYGLSVLMGNWLDPLVLATLIMAFEILITGGLHLDGLADSFDGLFSYRDKARMLEIMKDSRIGSNGVLILIVSLMLKTACLYVLLLHHQTLPLLWYPVVARCVSVFGAHVSPYARPEGMGNFFIGKTTRGQWAIALLITATWQFFIQPKAAWMIIICHISTLWFCSICKQKIDGMTGDTLGANTELQSLLILLVSVLMLSAGGQSICAWFY